MFLIFFYLSILTLFLWKMLWSFIFCTKLSMMCLFKREASKCHFVEHILCWNRFLHHSYSIAHILFCCTFWCCAFTVSNIFENETSFQSQTSHVKCYIRAPALSIDANPKCTNYWHRHRSIREKQKPVIFRNT